MTPAELKVIREALGLTGDALAALHHVSPRTVRHWEQGRYTIPEGVVAEVLRLEARADSTAAEIVTELQDQPDPSMTVYRDDAAFHAAHPDLEPYPAAWHRAVAYRVRRRLPHVRIEFPE